LRKSPSGAGHSNRDTQHGRQLPFQHVVPFL
jgi:hypothetical protein